MKLGIKPINEKLNEIPDMIVKFNYTNYDQSHFKGGGLAYGGVAGANIKGASYYVFDNFTIQFYDNMTNNIILSSNYPKAVYLVKANNVLKVIFEDIETKIKEHKGCNPPCARQQAILKVINESSLAALTG